jgi:uncharacterized protein with PIN domain
VLGCDTAYDPVAPDPELVRRSAAEGRVLLTRDRHLLRELRPPRSLEIRSDRPLAQLGQVAGTFALAPPDELFTRCLLCNVLLHHVPDAEHEPLVPAASRRLPGRVRRCPQCRRVYWPGSHVRRMRATLERALPGWLPREE